MSFCLATEGIVDSSSINNYSTVIKDPIVDWRLQSAGGGILCVPWFSVSGPVALEKLKSCPHKKFARTALKGITSVRLGVLGWGKKSPYELYFFIYFSSRRYDTIHSL